MRNENSWIEWGGEGRIVHFAHANGFPPLSYRDLLTPLTSDFTMVSWEARPLWPGAGPEQIQGWEDLAQDLVETLRSRGMNGIIGIGHSLGGVLSLMAAVRAPELFSALVLLDPVLFSGMRALVWRMMKATGRSQRMPLYDGAMRRRDQWPDREMVAETWSNRSIFAKWQASALDAYVENGVFDDPGNGVRLRYPKAWEARIFELTPHDVWADVKKVEIPILALRGEFSDTYMRGAHRRLRRVAQHARCEEVAGAGHMFPMEKPGEISRRIRDFLVSCR